MSTLKTKEDQLISVQEQCNILSNKLTIVEKKNAEEMSESSSRCDELGRLLRESEIKSKEMAVTISELQMQAELADRAAFQKWFLDTVVQSDVSRHVRFSDTLSESKPQQSSTESVRDLVITLLVQWRDQVGFYPRGASGPVTKAEQKFLQRITDFVMEAHERCLKAEKSIVSSEFNVREMDRKLRICMHRLEAVIHELYR